MRLSLLLVVITLSDMTGLFAQSQAPQEPSGSQEISLWSRNTEAYPWYFYTGKKFTADIRYNFDQQKTAAVCIGKKFGKDEFAVIPEACGYVGKTNGYGPEVWFLSDTKKYSLMSYVQYTKMLDTTSYGYSWFQGERKISRFGFGFGGQVLKNGSSSLEVDFGLSSKVTFGKVSFNFLPMWRVTSSKLGEPTGRGDITIFTGIAYTFGGSK